MRLDAGCEITFEVAEPTAFVLMLRPRSGPNQWVAQQSYELSPYAPVTEYEDSFGNLCQRLIAPAGRFVVTARAGVDTSPTMDVSPGAPYILVQDLPDNVIQFLLPSRYCQSDQLEFGQLTQEITAGITSGYDQAEAIRAWIHEQIEYRYGVSDTSTSALDTVRERSGVCRDFSHLGIALCRALSIPARLVVGYLHQLKPMDMHAWYEAYVGGRWYPFDATQREPRGGRICVAYGRDAADVALTTQFGNARLVEMRVWVNG